MKEPEVAIPLIMIALFVVSFIASAVAYVTWAG